MGAEATVAPSAGSRKEPRALKLKLPRRKPTTEVLQARGIELLKSFYLLCVILKTRHEREKPRNHHHHHQLQQIHSLTRCSDSLTTMKSSLPSLAVGDVIVPTNCPQLLREGWASSSAPQFVKALVGPLQVLRGVITASVSS